MPTGHPEISGLCLEPHDLCAAKIARNEQKDREFVSELINAGLVSPETIIERISAIEDPRFLPVNKETSRSFIQHLMSR